MHSLEVGVVPQHLVSQVLGDLFVDVGNGALLGGGELVPFLLLLLLLPQLLDLL